MKSLGIETRGATNTVVWVVVALAVFFWVLDPLKTKAFAGKMLPKKDTTTPPSTTTQKA